MWSKRKLCSSTLALLRSESLFRPRRHPPDPQPSRVSTRTFLLPLGPRVYGTSHHFLFLESRVSWGSPYSSEPESGGPSSRCWSCGAAAAASPGPFLFCCACRSVQSVDRSVDYFQIFGLERGYEMAVGNLEGKYKDWQKKLHPDLVHSKSEKERAFAAEQSARVIDAYRTLSKPLSRALYLSQLEGIDVDEEKTITDPDLLVEMLEIRETVDEANDSQTLKQIQSQMQKKFEAWSGSFDEAFKKRDFDGAVASIQRMRYYERAIEAIVKKL